ncbi:MAG: redoxin domain-containing protein [Phycisphaerales bacterium]
MNAIRRSLTTIGISALLVGFAAPAFAQGVGASAPAKPATPPGRENAPAKPAVGGTSAPARPSRDGAPGRDGAPARGAKIGAAAPDFNLPDTAGKMHKLSDYKGKIVVLQWINPECPVCQRVMTSGLGAKAQADAKAAASDVVWLFINSTAGMTPDTTKAYLEKNKSTTPGLIDVDGFVGHAYGAATTPHIFVIDDKGILRYQGAFDSDESGDLAKKGDKVTNYAVNAVKQIKAGETVTPDSTKSYGCRVKYAGAAAGAPAGGDKGRGTPPAGGRGATPPPAGGGRGTTPPPAGGGTGGGTGSGSGSGTGK